MKAAIALLAAFQAHNVNEELLPDIQAIYRAEVQESVSKNRSESTTDDQTPKYVPVFMIVQQTGFG